LAPRLRKRRTISELFIPESHCHFFYSIPFSFGVKGGAVERICFIFFFNLVSSLEFLDRPGKVKKAHLLVQQSNKSISLHIPTTLYLFAYDKGRISSWNIGEYSLGALTSSFQGKGILNEGPTTIIVDNF